MQRQIVDLLLLVLNTPCADKKTEREVSFYKQQHKLTITDLTYKITSEKLEKRIFKNIEEYLALISLNKKNTIFYIRERLSYFDHLDLEDEIKTYKNDEHLSMIKILKSMQYHDYKKS